MAVGEQNLALSQTVGSGSAVGNSISIDHGHNSGSEERLSARHAVVGVISGESSEIEPIVLDHFSRAGALTGGEATSLDFAASRKFSAWAGVVCASVMLAINVGITFLIVSKISQFEMVRADLARLGVGMLSLFAGFTLLIMALALAPSVLQGIRGRRLRSECLELLACAAGLGQSIATALSQSQPLVSGAVVGVPNYSGFVTCLSIAALCFVVAVKHIFEERAFARLRKQVGSALSGEVLSSSTVNDGNDGSVVASDPSSALITAPNGESIAPQHLAVGALISVKVGAVFPCDAQIVQGLCEVRERKVHGALEKCIKRPGDLITAGSVMLRVAPVSVADLSGKDRSGDASTNENQSRGITCKITAALSDSRLSAFDDQLMTRLASVREQFEAAPRMGESVYVLCLLVATLVISSIWGSFGTPPVTLMGIVMAILLIAPPSISLRLAPILRSLGLSAAYRRGAILNGEETLEHLAQTKRLVIDLNSENPPGTMRVTNFELIDQRVNSPALLSAVVAVAQAVTEQQRSDFESVKNASADVGADDEIEALLALRSGITNFELQRVHEVAHYPGRGIIATLEGAEFTIGDEEFLILRGVELQPSDLPESQPVDKLHCWYIAVGNEVVARLYLAERFTDDGREFISEMQRRGIAVSLVSEEPQTKIDPLGGAIGLELASIQGALTFQQLQSRVGATDDVGNNSMSVFSNRVKKLYSSKDGEKTTKPATVQCFNRLEWEFEAADVVLLGRSLGILVKLLDLARSFQAVCQQNKWAVIALCLLLFLGAASGTVPPWGVAFAMLLITMATTLNAQRIS